jgi:signal transduction histidine kinase
MKRWLMLYLVVALANLMVMGQHSKTGIPFFKNYAAADYQGNNRNSDIVTDDEGHVFVANFEGLLYFDQATWQMEHLKTLTRPTALLRDNDGTLWVNGYNYFGRMNIRPNGSLELLGTEKSTSILQAMKNRELPDSLYQKDIDVAITHAITIEDGIRAVATTGKGLFLYDEQGRLLSQITEQNGLCSNNINRLAYNGKGMLWGATENGLFAMSVPSAYSYFGQAEGLHGEVYSMREFAGNVYVGTTSGLYRQKDMHFERIANVDYLCWAMEEFNGQLLVASEGGLYLLNVNGIARQLNNQPTRALLVSDDVFFTGESDGVYLNKLNDVRYVVCDQSDVTRILKGADDEMWIQTLYGEIWYRGNFKSHFTKHTKNINVDDVKNMMKATLVQIGDKIIVVDALDEEPFQYPQFYYTDATGSTWLTDFEGDDLYVWKDGKRDKSYDEILYPLRDKEIRCIMENGKYIWFGGEAGVIILDRSLRDVPQRLRSQLRITSVVLNGDSVLWGGFGQQPDLLPTLKSNENNLLFTFALDFPSVLSDAEYQYRIDDNEWSKLSMQTHARFNNQRSGNHVFQVRAIDAAGNQSEVASIQFTISYPFYMKWYMIILYILILAVSVYYLLRWRTYRLEKDKQRLETIVGERTAEVVKQKDEIEEKSRSLETALSELSQAQHELIRQEKMASIGKLTQGLIDRILNPLNYINNFSKLSKGLVKDLEANIDDEKENMSEENFEDTKDVLGMLSGNLDKVSEHGQNTTRTLKAMEEMLKDRSGGIVDMDVLPILHQNEEMLRTYYASDISAQKIQILFDLPATSVLIKGNAEQLSKTFMSLLSNGIYAVLKKAQREQFSPELLVRLTEEADRVVLTFRDNGIGIEETIIDKIFDPFFTTKPTGEASGVGLYLSREIIQNHQGDISVKSEKNVFTEFTIVIPKTQ